MIDLPLTNRTLTWDNLKRRGWTGPGICIHCSGAEETILHLFFQCRFAKGVWRYICSSLRLIWRLSGHTTDDIVHHWFSHFKNHRSLIIFICWGLWRSRNAAIFRDTACSIIHTGIWILGLYNQYKGNLPDKVPRNRLIVPIDVLLYPTGFFDGAAQGHSGGAGCKFWISQNHSYNLWMGMEHCTNNCAEIIALWLCLFWTKYLGLSDIRIMGDSKVIIDWFNQKAKLHSILLQPWCRAIQLLIPCFTSVTVQHIYRELNGDADTLSKKGIGGLFGTLYFEELLDSTIIRTDHILIFD